MKFERHLLVIANLALSALSQRANQLPWLSQDLLNDRLEANKVGYGGGSNALELSSVATDDFTIVTHQLFPDYKLRLKRVEEFCDPTVKQYSGYLDVDYGAKHLFFSFFESRDNPDSDPVIMCVGVGFSYADYGETISTTEDAAKNVQAFVTIFFETFKKFKGRDFHMAGESYGGRYIPVFAAEIIDQNKRAEARGLAPINLRSVLIGNGATELKTMYEGYYDIQCKNLSMVPFLDISACVGMRQALPRCLSLYTKECMDRMDPVGCPMAAQFCRSTILEPFFTSRRNPYDMSKPCETDEEAVTPCYPFVKQIFKFLDRPEIRKALGVHPSIGNYSGCSAEVGQRFLTGLEQYRPTEWHVSGLLERGVRVLIYVGTYDWVCNWVGNYKWLLKLDWTGNGAFNAEKDRDWLVDGRVAGFTRSAHGLTFATVDGAGHMVPYDKPKEALVMLNRWLEEKDL